MLRPASKSIVARPRRKPQDAERCRINLSFNLGVQSEAAAYETLKKLSQARRATEFVTTLILDHLAAEAGKAKNAKERTVHIEPQESERLLGAYEPGESTSSGVGFTPTQEESSPMAPAAVPQNAEDTPVSSDTQNKNKVSQEGIAAAMEIFGF